MAKSDIPQLVQKGRSNIVDGHLKGAMTIMSQREASTDPTGVFLERVRLESNRPLADLTVPRPSDFTTSLQRSHLEQHRCLRPLGMALSLRSLRSIHEGPHRLSAASTRS